MRAPELPFASVFARSSIAARTISSGIRLADAARVRAQQPQLQLLGQLLGDRAVDEAAEAGVDAVRVLAACRAPRARRARARRASSSRAASESAAGARSTATAQTSATVRSSPVRPIAVLWATRRV